MAPKRFWRLSLGIVSAIQSPQSDRGTSKHFKYKKGRAFVEEGPQMKSWQQNSKVTCYVTAAWPGQAWGRPGVSLVRENPACSKFLKQTQVACAAWLSGSRGSRGSITSEGCIPIPWGLELREAPPIGTLTGLVPTKHARAGRGNGVSPVHRGVPEQIPQWAACSQLGTG